MNIENGKTDLNSLLDKLQKLETEKPRMYKKTKQKLHDMADICIHIVEVISRIIELDVLDTDDEEFGEKSNSLDVGRICTSMQRAQDRLSEFSNTTSTSFTSTQRKQIIQKYSSVLKALSLSPIPYESVRGCASALWEWFDARFLSRSSSEFRYNIRRIPLWIRDIVIMYGRSIESETEDEFVSKFAEWCDDVREGNIPTYAVPYPVYEFDRSQEPESLTLCATVMWDILWDAGLHLLDVKHVSEVSLTDSDVYNLCAELSPESLNHYACYSEDSKVLELSHLVSGGED